MNAVKQKAMQLAADQAVKYLARDPEKNIGNLIGVLDRVVVRDLDKRRLESAREILTGEDREDNNWYQLYLRVLRELDRDVLSKYFRNFLINGTFMGMPIQKETAEREGVNVPWTILMDPTSACNLRCTGCWAGEYSKSNNLSYETLDRIIREGKELGIYVYLYSGGEPTVRKDDLFRLAERHDDCAFLAFTNATLIDGEFARTCQRLGNIAFNVSVEGNREATDFRRGEGTYDKIIEGMDNLREAGVPFGFSTCYHRENVDSVGSDAFVDEMIRRGALWGWLFTYIPIGKDAVPDLVATPEQRETMYNRVREWRRTKPCFILDFWNDGEYVHGCIAGGRNYFHINANGDVEPCAFIHYSNRNINEVSLLEALHSPIFQQYREHSPFNENMLRPCPLLDNPEKLREMVQASGAKSTQPIDHESAEEVTRKCEHPAQAWTPVAERLWNGKSRGA